MMNLKNEISVGLVGAQFMGRAHRNAYLKVASAFDLPAPPVRRAACDINPTALEVLATRYGWETTETSRERLVARDDVDLIDICTANDLHAPIAIAQGVDVQPDFEHGWRCKQVLDAIQASARQRHWVDVAP